MCDACLGRRDLLRRVAALSAAALPLARAAAAAEAPLRIGYLPITDATPLLVAHGKGLFEAEGVAVDRPVLLRSWAQLIEAFIADQVDVVHLLSPMTIWARYGAHVPGRVVAWNHVDGSALTVAPSVGGEGSRGQHGRSAVLVFDP
jgi:NitT/TauT family transport system substrate-binding protein